MFAQKGKSREDVEIAAVYFHLLIITEIPSVLSVEDHTPQ